MGVLLTVNSIKLQKDICYIPQIISIITNKSLNCAYYMLSCYLCMILKIMILTVKYIWPDLYSIAIGRTGQFCTFIVLRNNYQFKNSSYNSAVVST